MLGNLCIKKIDLFEVWRKESTKKQKVDAVLKHVYDKLESSSISDEMVKQITKKINLFSVKLERKWKKCHRKTNVFKTQNQAWLNAELNIVVDGILEKATSGAVGRPRVPFSEKQM